MHKDMQHRTQPSTRNTTVTQKTFMSPNMSPVLDVDWAAVGGTVGDVVGSTEGVLVGNGDWAEEGGSVGDDVGRTEIDMVVGPTDGEIVGAIDGNELLVGGDMGEAVGESVGGLGIVGKLVGDIDGVLVVNLDWAEVGGTVGDVVGRTVGMGEGDEVGDF